ncbi:hypothetical protein GO986_09095 [Deinococcus sp. HMF7620]|uniref:Uncharacterized protein n=1 Tax=Deinococcus arboris TaxID=2682977 RepID=A0A7C9LTW7_9DEIO|nr:hypothetical protein [Deinococcus arboris]MVN86920.1 hypothetical protein [Deinococcus arboris]
MSAGPFPSDAMFLQLEAEAHNVVLDPGEGITFNVRTNYPKENRTFQFVDLTTSKEDVGMGELNISLNLSQANFAGIEVFDPQGQSAGAIYEAPVGEPPLFGYSHPTGTSFEAYTTVKLPAHLAVPGRHRVRAVLRVESTILTYTTAYSLYTTPGASLVLRDAGGNELTQAGFHYMNLGPVVRTSAGQLHLHGMRRRGEPTTNGFWTPGAFEIVDDTDPDSPSSSVVPLLRYCGRDGQDYELPFTLAGGGGLPGGGGGGSS